MLEWTPEEIPWIRILFFGNLYLYSPEVLEGIIIYAFGACGPPISWKICFNSSQAKPFFRPHKEFVKFGGEGMRGWEMFSSDSGTRWFWTSFLAYNARYTWYIMYTAKWVIICYLAPVARTRKNAHEILSCWILSFHSRKGPVFGRDFKRIWRYKLGCL